MHTIAGLLNESGTVAEFAKRYFDYLATLLAKLDHAAIGAFVEELEAARAAHRTVFVAGNGGSASTASHMATDLGVGFSRRDPSPPLRILALTDNSAAMTAAANDETYAEIFVAQLRVQYRPNDLLVVISASGNSPNVVRAAQWVRAQGGRVLGLVGFDGGALRSLCDVVLHVPTPKGEYGPVEDIHLMLNHLVTAWLIHRLRLEQGLVTSAAAP